VKLSNIAFTDYLVTNVFFNLNLRFIDGQKCVKSNHLLVEKTD
jgi:hypothetical protein